MNCIEEMGGPTGWQLATERVHKYSGNDGVLTRCARVPQARPWKINKLESSAKKSKCLQTMFPGRALVV